MRSFFAALVIIATASIACGDTRQATPAPSASIVLTVTPLPTASAPVRPSATDAGIAMHNLSGQIDDARRTMAKRPKDLDVRMALFDLLRQRAGVLDAADDLLEAAKLADTAATDFPDDKRAYLLKVRGLTALHRFTAARAWLEANVLCTPGTKPDALPPPTTSPGGASASSARVTPPAPPPAGKATATPNPKPGACPRFTGSLDDAERDRLVATLDLATGRYDAAEPVLRKRAEASPTSDNLHLHAVALGFMGRLEEADRRFGEALAAYRNVSPFPIAEMHADRAMMWQRAGDLTRATRDFEVANVLLPQHVHVATHLAGLRTPKEAVALLSPLATETKSADLLAALGNFEDLAKNGSGDAHLARARELFTELERDAPEAYADHAGWFWITAGKDVPRALRLARTNLAERETSEAFELAVRAATDAGDRTYACELAVRAKKVAYPGDLLLLYLKQLGDCPTSPAAPSSASPSASPSAMPPTSPR